MRTNGLKAWFLAARPKTLTGAAAPVIIGGALAFQYVGHLNCLPFLLCLLFAFVMQIDSNLINDYFDFRKGTDREDRLGPERACAQGWVTPKAMRVAIVLTTSLACVLGLPLIFWGGYKLILVGALCVLFCFLYTTCLSYRGYGDLLVLVFFGIVPVCMTFFVLAECVTWSVFIASVACGLAIDCLLMVNNYRDRNQDEISGKRTLVVRFGRKFGLRMYLWLGLLAFALGSLSINVVTGKCYSLLPLALYVVLHILVYRKMKPIDGKALNGVLGATARNIFLFGVLFALSLLV
ncbi:MAG: 1,4-dihydroxy-2-naphthoate octaprenyltransferase [Bacteroidaceae bacterium]|nr:1,4-dihydroxy-2-naphthoate octaprenyltransferase [Bacteroidaceae bacterium]